MTMRDPVDIPADASGAVSAEPRWGAGVGAVYAALAVIWAGMGTFTLAGLLPGAQSLLHWAQLSIDTLF